MKILNKIKQNPTIGPDFICIGAQKAGTSWLHWNLLWHPQALMPPEKEVNFFYPEIPELNEEAKSSPENFSNDNFSLGTCLQNTGEWYERYVKWRHAKQSGSSDFPFEWYETYLYSPRTSLGYQQLFPERKPGVISGDVSPSYADMSEQCIAKLALAAPDAKIIYLLRNPIDRAWSQFKMTDSSSLDSCKESDIITIVQKKGSVWEHSRYSSIIDKWEHHFPGRVKVFFYDQLEKKPVRFYMDICKYLGIRPYRDYPHNQIKGKIFAGPTNSMPVNLRQYLYDNLKDELLALHERFQNKYTKKWLINSPSKQSSSIHNLYTKLRKIIRNKLNENR